MGMVETDGLSHIHLTVRDLGRSVSFYRRVFGMVELFRQPHKVVLTTPGAGDAMTLEADAAGTARVGTSGGIDHFGFRLKDPRRLEEAIAEVNAAGGRLVRRGEHAPGRPLAHVADPDGYVIEL
jgi:catechol 2,3-dioxygenase-like lactoylglutathione lyase family enzyme